MAFWAQSASAAFGKAQELHEAFARLAVCDPVLVRPWVHLVLADLWLGKPERAIQIAELAMQNIDHKMLTTGYITALAMAGRREEAEQLAEIRLRTEDSRLLAKAQLAAMRGDGDAIGAYLDEYLSHYGPNDFQALILEAWQGDLNEANRLAGLIDLRPFGYMTLLQAIYLCTCGAPFDLDATPVFASMLAESGLPWPPPKPIDLPMKNW